MNADNVLKVLSLMTHKPEGGTKEFAEWLTQNDFLKFLSASCTDEIPVYVSCGGIYIYSAVVPEKVLEGGYIDDLMKWQCPPDSTWGYDYSLTRRMTAKNICVSGPFDIAGSKILKKATPLTFLRSYEGRIGRKGYVEFSQYFTHLNGLHYDECKNTYSRLNEEGDIEDIIKIFFDKEKILVTIKKVVMDLHLFACKSVLLRLFDVTRYKDSTSLSGGKREESDLQDAKNEIFARKGLVYDSEGLPTAGWLRGFQIIRNQEPRKKMLKIIAGKYSPAQKYEKFIAMDWKHQRIAECSCDEKQLDSYFTDTGKPFQITPAFFKPEVLLKYKQDKEKYKLTQRTISCRNSWHLQTYDINEAGQVHTYLRYLGQLPHSEQLHWKSYNEEPKGTISKRAFITDIKGDWDRSYNPLSKLMKSLSELQEMKKEFWSCEQGVDAFQLNYVVTDSLKEWTDEIHSLDKLVVECLGNTYLKGLAKKINCYEPHLGSIKLLKAILEKKGIDDQELANIISPLDEIHDLRTKFSGHKTGRQVERVRKQLISTHGNLKNHFRTLLERTEKAINAISELISKGYLE